MLLLKLFGLALLASELVAGVPTEAGFRLSVRDGECGADGGLKKRVGCTQPVQCGTGSNPGEAQQYSVETIKSAVRWAKRSFGKEGPMGNYPKYYGKSDKSVRDALPAECSGPGVTLYEFPIGTGPNFTPNYMGGDPGPDRIVLAVSKLPNGDIQRVFCMVMTHRGLIDNAFEACPASTG